MIPKKSSSNTALATVAALTMLIAPCVSGQSTPLRGLWVGSVKLQAVNGVAVPLDAANVPIAPDPRVPTQTYDTAELRLIIHVNGAGQASLLKDVAVLNREAAGGGVVEADMALVTDPRLYPEFPPQPAMRIASAAFDFGDAQTTAALDAIVEEAAQLATTFTMNTTLPLSTPAERNAAIAAAATTMTSSLDTISANADVAAGFDEFLASFDSAALTAIASDTNAAIIATLRAAAETLRDQSFFGDTRAVDMVKAVLEAASATADPAGRLAVVNNAAASAADVEDEYQRFIAGKVFSDMISACSGTAAASASGGGTAASIMGDMRATQAAADCFTAGLLAKVHRYDDTRSTDAIDSVLGAIAASAYANRALPASEIQRLAEEAGRAELSGEVGRQMLPVTAPTLDYGEFIASSVFQGAAQAAAQAAADAAIRERAGNALFTRLSVYGASKAAAAAALRGAYMAAARARRTELPLAGTFAPGSGDPRFTALLAQPGDLGPAGLTGTVVLPADHPTNPFRHRRHPDHTTGFDVLREIRLDFDEAPGGAAEAAGYGVKSITGTYREEIFGLHKALGPSPETDPIGLRTEGRFELTRISEIDCLNAR